jgi:acarbose 7IV-phosphotransferase
VTAEVVVVGAAGLDTCVYLPPGIETLTDVTFTSTRDGVGQAGGYASLGYAALGYRTAYIGAIGSDPAGEQVRAVLSQAGVATSACFDDPEGTARSVNLVHPDGRRQACYDGRGNPTLSIDHDRVRSVLDGSRLCHLNIPNWARTVIPIARECGVRVCCDLQDVTDAEDPYRLDFVLGADIIAFSCARDIDPEAMMRSYWNLNPGLVQIAGLGSHGCAYGADGVVFIQSPPVLDMPIVDTNGAGDALMVGFASRYALEGLQLVEAARQGQLAARVTCSQRVPKSTFASIDLLSLLSA